MLRLSVDVIFPIVILLGGLIFSFRFGFFSILHPIRFIRTLKDKNGSYKSLNLALAGTLGVGNIIGVVNAIRLGGAGAVFWMCISALLCANLKYAEAYMASLTKKRRDGGCFGGGYMYIEKTFRHFGRILAVIFTVFFMVSSFSTGACMQAGAVAESISIVLPSVPPGFASAVLGGAVLLSVLGGIRRISEITNKIVPAMTFLYLILSFVVIISRIENLPYVVKNILSSAFRCDGVIFGIGGFCFTECMRCGVMRGLLSNEAGCGSSATAHAMEEYSNPHRQGCLGIAEVYADTVVMCTVTAFAVLLGNADMSIDNDICLTLNMYEAVGGKVFTFLASLCICVFGYATLICFAGYGNECACYIFKNSKTRKIMNAVYLLFYIMCIVISPYIQGESVLLCADISMGIMALINIPALIAAFLRIKKPLRF